LSSELLEPTSEELDSFASEIVASIELVMLTVDELVTLSIDLELPVILDGGLDVLPSAVDSEAARRSLASKGFVGEAEDGPQLAPWLTLMADVASDPLVMVRMRRIKPDVAYEWTLFVDEHLGVQQQVGEDGVIAWAPFAVGDLFHIIVDAMGVDGRELEGDAVSFETSASLLAELDAAADSGVASSVAGVSPLYVSDLGRGSTSTSMLTIVDRTVDPAKVTDLVFAELSARFWELSFVAGSNVRVTSRSGESLLRLIVSALPIDPEDVFGSGE
jgi:hypothetical protein